LLRSLSVASRLSPVPILAAVDRKEIVAVGFLGLAILRWGAILNGDLLVRTRFRRDSIVRKQGRVWVRSQSSIGVEEINEWNRDYILKRASRIEIPPASHGSGN